MSTVSSQILLPVSVAAAFRVITALNTILRLSPFFTLKHIEPPADRAAQKGDRYSLTLEYYTSKMIETHTIEIDRLDKDRLISYALGSGIVRTMLFELQPVGNEIRLTLTFDLASENETIIKGTHDELHVWLTSIGNYLKLNESMSPLKSLQKCLMDGVWLRLSVSEKNIARIMLKISLLELALLLLLVLAWNIWTRIQ